MVHDHPAFADPARGLLLGEDDRRRQRVITSLLCGFFVDLGPGGGNSFADEIERLQPFVADGLLHGDGPRVDVLPLGQLLVRNMAVVLDPGLAHADGRAVCSRAIQSGGYPSD